MENIIYELGFRYTENKLEKENKNVTNKLNKLIEKEEEKREWVDRDKRIVNLTDIIFNTEETELLEKGLKYTPPPEFNEENMIIECESIIQKLESENDKKQMRWRISNVVHEIGKKRENKLKKEDKIKMLVRDWKIKLKRMKLWLLKQTKENMVLLKREEYIKKTEQFIIEGPYKEIKFDFTSKYPARIKSYEGHTV